MDVKTIPAFYGVYLLRSTVRKASNYIGSTPHPVRRLGQHNGRVKGGAARTSRATLRPWEMVCIVSGFPSNIAALQLEWAWTNPHLTRHIDHDKRISFAVTRMKTNQKTGKTRRKPARPSTSLLEKLSNLHLLLCAPYFSQWPLEVHFFSEDVFKSWQSWCERVDAQLHPSIKVVLDLPVQREPEDEDITSGQRPRTQRRFDLIGQGGIEGIDPTYSQLQDVLHKAQFILDEGDGQHCAVCATALDLNNDLYTICSHGHCQSLTHVRCLAQHFNGKPHDVVVPKTGSCPSCQGPLLWLDLMKEVSLRARNQQEVKKVLKKRQRVTAMAGKEVLETDTEDDLGADDESDVDEGDTVIEHSEDARSEISMESLSSVIARTMGSSPPSAVVREEIIIEDSDDDRG